MVGLFEPTVDTTPGFQNVLSGTEIPEWVSAAGQEIFGQAKTLANQPYDIYGGPRVAPLSTDEQNAQQGIRNLQGNWQDPLNQAASSLTGGVNSLSAFNSQNGTGLQDYLGNVNSGLNMIQNPEIGGNNTLQNAQNLLGGVDDQIGFGNTALGQAAGQIGQASTPWDTNAAQQYMSPFQQNVTDIAAREFNRNSLFQQQNANATASDGAFGGSRHGFLNSEIDRNRQLGLSDIYLKGGAEAYNTGLSAFNADQNRAMQGAGLTQQGAGLYQQGANALTQGANTQLNLYDRPLAAANQMFAGANAGYSGLDRAALEAQTYGDLANQQAQLAATQQNLGFNDANTLSQYGALDRSITQGSFDTAYQDYLDQREYPYRQVNFVSGALKGTPYETRAFQDQTSVNPQLSTSSLGQLAGAAAATIGGLKYFGG